MAEGGDKVQTETADLRTTVVKESTERLSKELFEIFSYFAVK